MSEIPAGYQGVRELGRGGMGVVWLATELATGRPVVIKRLLAADDLDLRRRFQREAEALAALRHPAVLGIYSSGVDLAGPFLVLEFVAGVALDAVLKSEGPRPIEEVVDTLIAMAEGLAACHAADVCHRDLKPANVLRENGTGRIVMVDFGLAGVQREGERLTMTGQLLGTPGYMAPEQLDGSSRLDAKTDIWGLCATGYALLTGQAPRQGTLLEMQTHHARGKSLPRASELRPEVPAWLDGVLEDGMAEDPEQRPRAEELIVALQESEELESRREAREVRERRWKIVIATMIALLFCALVHELPRLLADEVSFQLKDPPPTITRLERLDLLGGFFGRPGAVEVRVDGFPTVFTELRGKSLPLTVELGDEGRRDVELHPVDGWGRALPVVRFSVVVDRTPPEADIDWSGALTELRVRGTVEDDDVEVSLDGKAIPLAGRTFEALLPKPTSGARHELIVRDAAGNVTRSDHRPVYLVGSPPPDWRKRFGRKPDRAVFKLLGTPGRGEVGVRLLPGVHRFPVTIRRPVTLVGEPDVEVCGDGSRAALEIAESATVTAIGVRIRQPDTGKAPAIRSSARFLRLKDCEVTSNGMDVLHASPLRTGGDVVQLLIENCRFVRGGIYALRQLGGRARIKGLEVRDAYNLQVAARRRGDMLKVTGELTPAGGLKRYSVLFFGRGSRAEIDRLDLRHVYDQAVGIAGGDVLLRDSQIVGYARSGELGTEAYGIIAGKISESGRRRDPGERGRLTAINSWIIEGKKAMVLTNCEVRLRDCRVLARNQAIYVMGHTSLEMSGCLIAGHPAARNHFRGREPDSLVDEEVNGKAIRVPTFSGVSINTGPEITVRLADCRVRDLRGPPIMVGRRGELPFQFDRKTPASYEDQWPRGAKAPKLTLERVEINTDAKAPDISEQLGEWRIEEK